MKHPILLFALCCIVLSSFGQAKPATPPSKDCFKDWYTLFRERGANPIPDGTNDVIITLRNGDYSDCFLGRVDVLNGNLNGNFKVQKVDGSYADFDKSIAAAYQTQDGRLKEELRAINEGMTASVPLSDGEMIRLFFFKSLKDKALANKKAPAPSALIKN
ncbi:MAG TPA: hypothetical protein PLR06_04985 [Cyclobacteriaceae bacterium]|nr:hypothetical protein [Cyclobacteriaceae bacterium]